MEYTKNYHLPQWAEEDRIMRADFNQMCADIEAGLDKTAQAASAARQDLRERWYRLAYNHYCAVREMEPFPPQTGLFHQDPAKDAAGVSGAKLLDGVCFVAKGTGTISAAAFPQYVQQLTRLKVVKGNPSASTPLTAKFRVPVSGKLERLTMDGSYSGNTPDAPASIRVTLTNQDSGEDELIYEQSFAQTGVSGTWPNYYIHTPVYFHGGTNYLLTVEPLGAVFSAEADLVFSEAHSPAHPAVNDAVLTASRTLREAAESGGGLLILRCSMGGTSGALTVRWDGDQLQPHASRTLRLENGRAVRELVYRRDGPLPAETTVSLQYDCGECGDFLFYDWGAVLM